jgi:hypothetical protein
MGWRLKIYFDDGTEDVDEDVYDTEEDAEAGYDLWLDSWGAGRETLKLAGEDYIDANIEGYEIWEE